MRKSERLSPIKTAQTSYRPRKLSTRENEDKSSFASQPEGNMEKPPKPINRITLTKQQKDELKQQEEMQRNIKLKKRQQELKQALLEQKARKELE